MQRPESEPSERLRPTIESHCVSSVLRGCLRRCPTAPPCPCAAACLAPSRLLWLPFRFAWSWPSGRPPRLRHPSFAALDPRPSCPRRRLRRPRLPSSCPWPSLPRLYSFLTTAPAVGCCCASPRGSAVSVAFGLALPYWPCWPPCCCWSPPCCWPSWPCCSCWPPPPASPPTRPCAWSATPPTVSCAPCTACPAWSVACPAASCAPPPWSCCSCCWPPPPWDSEELEDSSVVSSVSVGGGICRLRRLPSSPSCRLIRVPDSSTTVRVVCPCSSVDHSVPSAPGRSVTLPTICSSTGLPSSSTVSSMMLPSSSTVRWTVWPCSLVVGSPSSWVPGARFSAISLT